MTSKEKADELIYKFAQIIPPSSYVAYEGGVQINFDLENSKICALIAVDELINCTLPSCEFGGIINNNTIEYWEEVKQEIEKL
jgi:hypothetical protein